MKIAVIVAMEKELNLLLPTIGDTTRINANGYTFYLGQSGPHQIIACQSGIGKVNAAIGTVTLIDMFHPNMVINSGVAGSTGAGTNPVGIGEVLLASEIAYHDVWCGPGTVHGQAAGYPLRFKSPLDADFAQRLQARSGLLASGDRFIDSPADMAAVLTAFPDAVAVDMESAAIAQVCHLKDVPFVCLRVVSDAPGPHGNAQAYEAFWASAPEKTFHKVEQLISML